MRLWNRSTAPPALPRPRARLPARLAGHAPQASPWFRRACRPGLPAPSRGGYGRGGKAAGGGAGRPRQVRVRRGRGGVRELRLLTVGSEARARQGRPDPSGFVERGGRCRGRPLSPLQLLLRGLTPFKTMSVLVTVLCKNCARLASACAH